MIGRSGAVLRRAKESLAGLVRLVAVCREVEELSQSDRGKHSNECICCAEKGAAECTCWIGDKDDDDGPSNGDDRNGPPAKPQAKYEAREDRRRNHAPRVPCACVRRPTQRDPSLFVKGVVSGLAGARGEAIDCHRWRA
jgi:hypothetical protein